ncbi:hypothetical protein EON80_27690, partial [bacterium]
TTPTATSGEAPGAGIEIIVGANNSLQAVAYQAGDYTLERATGPALKFTVPAIPFLQDIDGPWQIAFPANSGAPATTTVNALTSLTDNLNPAIKYFSGTATYSKDFTVSADALKANRHLTLDLGIVADLAQVTLNGKVVGTVWQSPYAIDISKFAQAGSNHLEVAVTNTWHNRLVAFVQSPDVFAAPGVEQLWASVWPGYGPGEGLYPAGLIGPVTLRQAAVVTVH